MAGIWSLRCPGWSAIPETEKESRKWDWICFLAGWSQAGSWQWMTLGRGSMAAAREKGLVRSEGKEYVMKDGDIVLFRFNV